MTSTLAIATDEPFEEFVHHNTQTLSRYLQGVLGTDAEGAGGRVGVADTLQEGLLRVLAEWPELQHTREPDRDRRLYRCLRDAACDALRAEHGRTDSKHTRPQLIAFDFDRLGDGGDELPLYERELAASVLGATIRNITDTASDGRERRGLLTRAILLAGLRALSEKEALIMIAVDDLDWDQDQLAEHLQIKPNALRQTLFGARKIFQGLLRHAIGLDLDEEERARLHAYQAGELHGAENRHARRHLQHCQPCQTYVREQHAFCENARTVLTPLPFVLSAGLLTRPATKKTAATSTGLLSQAGSTKALASVVALLGLGFGTTAILAGQHPISLDLDPSTGNLAIKSSLGEIRSTAAAAPTPAPIKAKVTHKAAAVRTPTKAKLPARSRARAAPASQPHTTPAVQPQAAPTPTPTPAATPTSAPPVAAPSPAASTGSSSPKKRSGGGEFFGQ